jgi:twitching motility protein PilT
LAYRETGEIIKAKEVMVSSQDLQDLLAMNCNEKELAKFEKTHELDSAVMLSGLRFRANFYKTINGPAAVLRRVESKIPEMDQFDLPQVLYDIVDMHKGLVLVTGPTGSGKSTTLAAIVNEINKTKNHNIITVEDPVEFIHKDQQSIISHREIGKQTESFASALKAALREDPDVILVGEMRDLETVGLALTAAETGHLVFGTLHTSGAPETINRIIDVFPPEQQSQIRAQISTSLKMVVTQKLLKTKDGQGRVAAFEVMKCTPPIQNLIREAKIHQIPTIMQTSVRDGMITMSKSLEELVSAGKIDGNAGKDN